MFYRYWRVKSRLHTTAQTIVGASLGTIVGLLSYKAQQHIANSYCIRNANIPFCILLSDGIPRIPRLFMIALGFTVLYRKGLDEFQVKASKNI